MSIVFQGLRPRYHFMPQQGWMNDPNGPIYLDGQWHLFFQHNPHGDQWGHLSWGHATSPDLMTWTERPLAIAEDTRHMIFSGSTILDTGNVSALGGSVAPLLAFYTGEPQDRTGPQIQCLAYSCDRGTSWETWADNPILDLGLRDFRDPKVFWYAPGKHWVMAVALSAQRKIAFFASADLLSWHKLSHFSLPDCGDREWECPNLLKLPVEGGPGAERWVLFVSVGGNGPAGGSGIRYFIGDFDGERFQADADFIDTEFWADQGPDFYAAQSWSNTPDKTPLWIGWMNNLDYASRIVATPARGMLSIPRTLGLKRTEEGLRLYQQPAASPAGIAGTWPEAANIALWSADPDTLTLTYDDTSDSYRLGLDYASGIEMLIEHRPSDSVYQVRRRCRRRGPAFDEDRMFAHRPNTPPQLIIDGPAVEIFGLNGVHSYSLSGL